MKLNIFKAGIFMLVMGVLSTAAIGQDKPDPKFEKKRQEVRKMAAGTLKRLYKAQPLARDLVEKGAGYAVFSDVGVKILFTGSGKGQGIAVDNKTKQETFMKMFELQAGLGFGVKKFKVIFIFHTPDAMNKFVESGWEFGGQTTAAAKSSQEKGAAAAGASTVSDGVSMYQMTDKGLALEITAKGTKYYKDDDLNKKP